MEANAEIFFEHDRWGHNVAWSVALHLAVAGCIVLYAAVASGGRRETWGIGGTGDAMGVTLVSTVPLPANPTETQNVLANESKGVSQSLPKAQEEEASNVVPFGEGGPVSGPYGIFSAGGAKGGFGFTGGGGDFGTRFSWYVRVVQQKVSENWLKYEVDPGVTESRRVYLMFDITRDGRPGNVTVEQSSGVPSLDQSAVRALQRIDTFGPLPSDYSSNKVSVEFWFDYKR